MTSWSAYDEGLRRCGSLTLQSQPFSTDELAEIDAYAIDPGVDLWTRSRSS